MYTGNSLYHFRNPKNPDFKYPASHNPYWDKILQEGLNLVDSSKYTKMSSQLPLFLDHHTEIYAEKWRETLSFPPQSTLHVELGCNAGHVILPLAQHHPQTLHIGIDWKFKALYWAAEKALVARSHHSKLDNLFFFRAHSERLPFMFGPEEISSLALYFPDPWEKPSQKKHRFFNLEQLKAITPLVSIGGVFHIKTDHDDYFKQMLSVSEKLSPTWSIEKVSWNLHQDHSNPTTLDFPDVTLFEKLFIKKGIPIKSLLLRKSGA